MPFCQVAVFLKCRYWYLGRSSFAHSIYKVVRQTKIHQVGLFLPLGYVTNKIQKRQIWNLILWVLEMKRIFWVLEMKRMMPNKWKIKSQINKRSNKWKIKWEHCYLTLLTLPTSKPISFLNLMPRASILRDTSLEYWAWPQKWLKIYGNAWQNIRWV